MSSYSPGGRPARLSCEVKVVTNTFLNPKGVSGSPAARRPTSGCRCQSQQMPRPWVWSFRQNKSREGRMRPLAAWSGRRVLGLGLAWFGLLVGLLALSSRRQWQRQIRAAELAPADSIARSTPDSAPAVVSNNKRLQVPLNSTRTLSIVSSSMT
jgi:hypothetical protein